MSAPVDVSATTEESSVVPRGIDQRLLSFIATRDKRVAKDRPWDSTPLLNAFNELLAKGSVRMGGRTTCGNYADPTWRVYSAWNEVVRKARSLGFAIEEVSVKHGNGWATKAGGFWDEADYKLIRTGATP
jgi:hypothetical protein